MKLKKNNNLPLDKFINLSLYDKNFGYYMKKNPFLLNNIKIINKINPSKNASYNWDGCL